MVVWLVLMVSVVSVLVGFYFADLGVFAGVLGFVGKGVITSLLVMGLVVVWGCDNVMGLSWGVSASMGYGVVMGVALVLWGWCEWVKYVGWGFKVYVGHYVVAGVGGWLGVFMPFMELFSCLVRPVTLGVRLSTNMTSGHVLMVLAGVLAGCGGCWGLLVFGLGWLLGFMEMFVCVLQAFVFSMLVAVYVE